VFNTYDSCFGCPFRCSGSNPHCPYSSTCLGCHGKCPGYQTRSETRQKENDLRRMSCPDVTDVEFNKRLDAKVARAYQKRKTKEQIILKGVTDEIE